MWTTPEALTFAPVIHIVIHRFSTFAGHASCSSRARATTQTKPARTEVATSGTEIAIVIGAAANAAGVIVGLGRVQQSLTDIRDDIRATREEVSSCLKTLLLLIKPGNPGQPH